MSIEINEDFSINKLVNLPSKDQVDYLIKYIKQMDTGDYIMLRPKDQYKVITYQQFSQVYKPKLDGDNKKLFSKRVEVYNTCVDIHKPFIYGENINLAGQLRHKYKPYKDFSDKAKKGVDVALNFLHEVWCCNIDEQYNYILKWMSNMIKGNKNETALLAQGPKGIGKSTWNEFLTTHVIGSDLILETGSEPLRSRFNKILMGKLLVVFEELENMSIAQWCEIGSKLKRMITSNKIVYEEKNEKCNKAKNINNYIILSNHDAIKEADGRRYFCVDISTKYREDFKYFKKLTDTIMNDEVGHAFYSYLKEIDTSKFFSGNMPLTTNKKDKISERLEDVFKFLKEEFILKKKNIKATVAELYEDYKVSKFYNAKMSKVMFCKKLREVGIENYKSGSTRKYSISFENLKKIATKYNWIHELDEYKEDDDDFEFIDNEPVNSITLHEHEKQIDNYETKLKELEQEIKKLKNDKKHPRGEHASASRISDAGKHPSMQERPKKEKKKKQKKEPIVDNDFLDSCFNDIE